MNKRTVVLDSSVEIDTPKNCCSRSTTIYLFNLVEDSYNCTGALVLSTSTFVPTRSVSTGGTRQFYCTTVYWSIV
jgi:hypothetical protein